MLSIATWSLLILAGLSAAEVYTGTAAKIEDYPSIVQVETRAGLFWVQVCVGSVLTSRHVLSAAHCFVGPLVDNFAPRIRRIRAGAGERGRDGQVLAVESVARHPSFTDELGFDGDIVVVRLSSAFTFGSTIQQASITGAGVTFPANVPVTVAGWGRTAQQDAIWANRNLHSVNLVTVDTAKCTEKYASLPFPITVTENMICLGAAGAEGTEVGIRDGGAPVYYDGILVGVVIFGSPYGQSFPLVTTAVSSFTEWIVATAV